MTLVDALRRDGITSKLQHWSNGRIRGGTPFGRGALYHLLANRLYLGEIRHHDEWHAGEHDGIIDQPLWDAVQAQLARNAVTRKLRSNARDASLLVGRIRDGQGRGMRPSHASKGKSRYRYYVSFEDDGQAATRRAERIAAGDVEPMVLSAIRALLADRTSLLRHLTDPATDAETSKALVDAAQGLALTIDASAPLEQRGLVDELDLQLVVDGQVIKADIALGGLANRLGVDDWTADGARVPLAIASRPRRRGREIRLIVTNDDAAPVVRDARLIALLAKTRAARAQLIDANATASTLYSDKHIARLARLAYLAPDIVTAILAGKQPRSLTARQMLRAAEIPLAWAEQRKMFGFI